MKKRQFLPILCMLSFLMACHSQTNKKETKSTASESETSTPRQGIQNVDVVAFKAKMKEENVVLLDVRTPKEIAQGKIGDALEIDVLADDFQTKISSLDKNKTYLVYCKAGGRSANACEVMEKAGFPHLYNLEGGFTAWKSSEDK